MTAAATPGFVEWSGDGTRPTRKARLGCSRRDSAATGATRRWRGLTRAAALPAAKRGAGRQAQTGRARGAPAPDARGGRRNPDTGAVAGESRRH